MPSNSLAPTDATKVAANKLEIFANGDLDSLAGKSIGSADGSIGFGEASTTLDGCTGCAHGTITFNGGDLWYSGGWRAAQGAQVWPWWSRDLNAAAWKKVTNAWCSQKAFYFEPFSSVFFENETQLRRFLLSLDFDGIFDINSMYNIVRIQLARTCKGPFFNSKDILCFFFVPLAFNGIIKNNKRKRGTCTGLLQSNIL